MKRKISLAVTVALLTILLVACHQLTPDQYKQILSEGLKVFTQAEAIYNPGWNTTQIKTLGQNAINAWGVGATWQQNVINEIPPMIAIVQAIPNCDAKCSLSATIFEGGLTTVMIYLEGQVPPAPVTATARAKRAPRAGVTTYKSFADYRKAWNAQAPPSAQIK